MVENDDEFDRLAVIASDRLSVFLVDQYARQDLPAVHCKFKVIVSNSTNDSDIDINSNRNSKQV